MRFTEWLAVGVGFALLALMLQGCAVFSTGLIQCEKMCGEKASLYEETKHGPKCVCGGEDGRE